MELKAQPGGDLVLGGANLAATFMRYDLIDEYRLYVHPVVTETRASLPVLWITGPSGVGKSTVSWHLAPRRDHHRQVGRCTGRQTVCAAAQARN